MSYFNNDEEDINPMSDYADMADSTPVDTPEPPVEPSVSPAPAGAVATVDPLDNPGWSLEDLDKPSVLDESSTPVAAPEDASQVAASIDDPLTALQQYGGVEGAVGTLQVVDQLISGTEEGVTSFLQTMYESAQPAYAKLVDQVIAFNPEYAVQQLQAAGYIPADLNPLDAPPPAISSIEPEVLESIPEHLRQVALSLPAEVQEDLNMMSDAVRNQTLAEKKELQDMRNAIQQQQQQQQQQRYEEAVRSGAEQREQLLAQLENGHMQVLSKWQPWGPDAQADNQMLYESLLEGTMRTVLADAKYAQMYRDFNQLMSEAPLKALEGNKMAANTMTQQARGLAAQFNVQFSRELQSRVSKFDKVFRGSRGSQSAQTAAPVRKEVRGSVISDGKKVSAIGPDGQATDEFLNSLVASLKTTQ